MTKRITFLLIACGAILTCSSFSQDRLSRERTVFGTSAPMDYDRFLNRHLFKIDPKDSPILLGAVYKPSDEKEWGLWVQRDPDGTILLVLAEPDSSLFQAYLRSKSINDCRTKVVRTTKAITSDDFHLLDLVVENMIENAQAKSRYGVDGWQMSFFRGGFGAVTYIPDADSRSERLCSLFRSLRAYLKEPQSKDFGRLKDFRTKLDALSTELAIKQ